MTGNALLRWLVPGALAVIVLIIVRGWATGTPAAPPPADAEAAHLSPEEAKTLGVAGDTPRDTVATLVGQVKAMRSEMVSLKKSNDTLQAENHRLRTREGSIDTRLQSALGSVTEQVNDVRNQAQQARLGAEHDHHEAKTLLSQVKDQLAGAGHPDEDLPVGLGLQPGDGQRVAPGSANPPPLQWVEPSDTPAAAPARVDPAASLLPSSFTLPGVAPKGPGRAQTPPEDTATPARDRSSERRGPTRPVYTLPENATLVGAVALTALIGRVPVDGTVSDPYPFKVLVGPQNLTANGIDLPDVAGAVMSGTAAGDWTLSCVRGQVESITFVFGDGTVRTVPPPPPVTSRQAAPPANSHTDHIRGGLGYLSDPYGVPCIAGERRSNAQQYLGSQGLITAAGAGLAGALGTEQHSTGLISTGKAALGVDQTRGNSALNAVLSAGIGDLRKWVNTLYGEAFAAVYVPPSATVALHLDHEITIDYAPQGRRVNHEHTPLPARELD